ncbi:FCD domain-containing protein [Geminicoccus roseus]|uniref:FCD domain-containing protein n=1 Tax=Geminicoccus roseus TaxID=404900 RepID=UPI000A00AD02|nr:FCD domain-containing protein [Geminicoccus roseus]
MRADDRAQADRTAADVRHALGGEPGRRLADVLADAILALVKTGEIAPGSYLPAERDLMRRFGVSRAAVREAIALLANQGVLRTRPGHRPRVQAADLRVAIDTLGGLVRHLVSDEAGVWNLFEARIFIEAALVRHAASHARPGDIAALQAALAENRAAIGDTDRFYATDVGFHGVLYQIPGNPIYPALHRAFVEWLSEHWAQMPRSVEIDRMNYQAHKAIVDSILDRDPEGAERMLRSHLAAAWEFVRASIRDQ